MSTIRSSNASAAGESRARLDDGHLQGSATPSRDVGAALGMPPVEVDETPRPSPSARDARQAIADLRVARPRELDSTQLATLFDLVRNSTACRAISPCTRAGDPLRPRCSIAHRSRRVGSTSHEPVRQGRCRGPLGCSKSMSAASGCSPRWRMPWPRSTAPLASASISTTAPRCRSMTRPTFRDDPHHAHTLGCFQIESPGQQELIGKFRPVRF